jgi:hypothetical protein
LPFHAPGDDSRRSIRHLHLQGLSPSVAGDIVSKHRGLMGLALSDMDSFDLELLKSCPDLRQLWLGGIRTIENFTFLSSLKRLRTVSVVHCGGFQSLAPLVNCSELQVLEINVDHLSFSPLIKEVPNLELVVTPGRDWLRNARKLGSVKITRSMLHDSKWRTQFSQLIAADL